MKIIDYFLDRITMYRLMLYFLVVVILMASVLGFLGIIPYSFSAIASSTIFLVAVCFVTNKIFSFIFKAPTNIESCFITALILSLIITPPNSISDFYVLVIAGTAAMASKYILAVKRKHIFNPAAFAVFFSVLVINKPASWWVGNEFMLPVILVGGILILRKIQKKDLFLSFLLVSFATISISSFLRNLDFAEIFKTFYLFSPFFFFSFVMLVEPLTSPSAKKLQILYGSLVGFLFIYLTPETALLVGNVFFYLVSPKQKLMLSLKEKTQIGPGIFEFIFKKRETFSFLPGQYMEWTLEHPHTDTRGNRRYFTIASSPTEKEIKLGIKFYQAGSSFKRALVDMTSKTRITAGYLAGDFILPKNKDQKCVFIAGGIGITPFRSMIKYLLDKKEKRPIILLYAVKSASEIVYKDILTYAQKELNIKTVYAVSGRIDGQLIKEEVPDYKERLFYLSGPHSMVTAFTETLHNLGIKNKKIKKDFFPGYS